MVKLLHTGDIHLGKQFPVLQSKAGDYRHQLIRTFEKIVDLAGKEGISLLLVAGDLFDTNRLYGLTVSQVISAFKKLEASNIRACLIPGSHDDYSEDSIYRSVLFPPNVTVLTPEHSHQAYPDLDLAVDGLVPETSTWEHSPLQGFSPDPKFRFHVALVHCPVVVTEEEQNEKFIMGQDDIARSGLDYLALGHYHSFRDCSQDNTAACYCGSPEPLDFYRQGTGNAVIVKLAEGAKAEFQAVPVGTKKCDSINIGMETQDSIDTVIRTIEDRSDPNLILEVILTGSNLIDRFPNIPEIEKMLSDRFFSLRIIDRIHPQVGKANLKTYPDKTVAGRYLRVVEEKIAAATAQDKPLYEESLKLGFNLLQGNLKVME